MDDLRRGEILICKTDQYSKDRFAPKYGDKCTVDKLRIVEKIGLMVTFMEFREETYYDTRNFNLLDITFAEDLLHKLFGNQKL